MGSRREPPPPVATVEPYPAPSPSRTVAVAPGRGSPAIVNLSPRAGMATPSGAIAAAMPVAGLPTSMPPGGASGRNDYRILPADILEVTVFQEPDLKSTLRVSNEGTITFPLVGVVQVGGLSPQEAALQIRAQLAKGYLQNPQVTLTVMEFSKRRFTVLGQVQKPGSYDMPDQQEITVLQAIGMAGGYTRIANASRVTLMRRAEGREQTFALDAKSMAKGSAQSTFAVFPGDVITVGESRF